MKKNRSFKVEDDLWYRFKLAALKENKNVMTAVNEAIKIYSFLTEEKKELLEDLRKEI